jgi:hypothetical protein
MYAQDACYDRPKITVVLLRTATSRQLRNTTSIAWDVLHLNRPIVERSIECPRDSVRHAAHCLDPENFANESRAV